MVKQIKIKNEGKTLRRADIRCAALISTDVAHINVVGYTISVSDYVS